MQLPKYEYGAKVRLVKNIRSDGTVENAAKGVLLMRRGTAGYVRQSGFFQQDTIVYQVHFIEQNTLIGCKESELISALEPWVDNQFEYGDSARLNLSLSMGGQVIAEKNDLVSVLGVNREDVSAICYRIQVNGQDVDVPERALASC
ncbi:nitrogen fixation protein NifZ [Echinimonas agarilytica]|uniref:Nitrogen fixation protein NifZ n=1 Tax=Echinimonas agarilytica TaxID=1215918 RepID=A0AA42B8E4_9GAMM|nr:nitrogen fixation protein NifZ [Echinimonas agarilytica]MCM2680438.1 nitrogen fixation protein NifZ [Echinimonas agarilytica]